MWVWSLGWDDLLEKGMATHSSVLTWKIPWTEVPGRLQSTGPQRVRHDWSGTHTHTHIHTHTHSGYRHLLFFCFAFPSTQVPPPGLNSQLELSHYICIPAQEGKRRKDPTPPFEGISWESHTKLLIISHLPEISQWKLHRKLRIIIFILGNEIPA